MWRVAKYVPSLDFAVPARKLLVAVFFCLGGIVAMPAIASFRSAGTTVDPRVPEKASRLVVTGIYRYSRNPMYLGLAIILLGWGIHLGNPVNLLCIAAFMFVITKWQIKPEEAALRDLFGEEYDAYCRRVRRWI